MHTQLCLRSDFVQALRRLRLSFLKLFKGTKRLELINNKAKMSKSYLEAHRHVHRDPSIVAYSQGTALETPV